MHIHNMSQQRMVAMLEATFPEGPRHQEVWTSTITSGSMFTWGRRDGVIDNGGYPFIHFVQSPVHLTVLALVPTLLKRTLNKQQGTPPASGHSWLSA